MFYVNAYRMFFIIITSKYGRHSLMISSNLFSCMALEWRHNESDGVSNHRCLDCLLSRLFKRRSKKKQSSALLAFVRGIHRWQVNSLHKGLVTRKMFPFDYVVMEIVVFLFSFPWAIILTHDGLVYWRVCASFDLDEWSTDVGMKTNHIWCYFKKNWNLKYNL